MSFAANALALNQEHFAVVKLTLPAFSSGDTCTLAEYEGEFFNFYTSNGKRFLTSAGYEFKVQNDTGYYTPLTCDETYTSGTKDYYFATENVPLNYGRPPSSSGMPADIIEITDPIHPVILNITETVTELQPGKGLSIQGSAKIVMRDFVGDPGPVTKTYLGTYFGKLDARNVLINKVVEIHQHHVLSDNIYADSDAEVRKYYVESFTQNANGTWTLNCKDLMSKLDFDKAQFPKPTGGTLRAAINDTDTAIPVDSSTDWNQISTPYVIRVGDEFMKVTAVSNNQTATAELTVATRGSNIVFTNTISRTTKDDHDTGDDVQICYTSDNQNIADFLKYVMEDAGFASGDLDYSNWLLEIAEWHPSDKIDMIWHEPTSSQEVVQKVCTDFLLDMWYDPVALKVKMAAISVWQESGATVEEGKQINRDTFRTIPKENLRYSRAFIYYDKPFKVKNDDVENYRALSLNINSIPEGVGLFGEPKTKEFKNSPILGQNAAALLVQRTTARFGFTPEEYTWETEERFLNYSTGDIVDILTNDKQGFDGRPKSVRAQITSVQPIYNIGRKYRTKALTYEPAFADGTVFTIDQNSNNLNLHTFVGGPSGVVNVTIVIDGASISSSSHLIPAIIAGGFTAGSTIKLILINNADLQAAGGPGGEGGASVYDGESETCVGFPGDIGGDGGTVYAAQGIDTDIYLGGTIDSYTSVGTLKAPGGGGGGEDGFSGGSSASDAIGGDGGGGGAGNIPGGGGAGGFAASPGTSGTSGDPGDTSGNGGAAGGAGAGAGGNWGTAGSNGDSAGGAAGKGITKTGAVVNIYTDGNSGRFINGSGDTPDATT